MLISCLLQCTVRAVAAPFHAYQPTKITIIKFSPSRKFNNLKIELKTMHQLHSKPCTAKAMRTLSLKLITIITKAKFTNKIKIFSSMTGNRKDNKSMK